MDLNLRTKHALVCGSTQGIGKATALELALLGASVTLIARNEDALQQVLTELDTGQGQQHDYLVADFSQPEVLAEKIQVYAGQKAAVHILVNNTGGPAGGPILEAAPEAFRQAFFNHLICNHILAQALVPGMKTAGYGRIINIISTSVKQPLPGLGVSNTTRGAVANWAKTLSYELAAFGITVNNVLPGATVTGRHTSLIEAKAQKTGQSIPDIEAGMLQNIPAGRFGAPQEVAAMAAFLATPAAAYINGVSIQVDGGRTSSH
jgi:3-oxoacyl-[acyl-carrier protein] reductase